MCSAAGGRLGPLCGLAVKWSEAAAREHNGPGRPDGRVRTLRNHVRQVAAFEYCERSYRRALSAVATAGAGASAEPSARGRGLSPIQRLR